jgi:hypothetical protein
VSAIDWRTTIDVGGSDGSMIALEIEDPRALRPLTLTVIAVGGAVAVPVDLDYSEAGELFDRLAQALGIVVSGSAESKLRRLTVDFGPTTDDTPRSAHA